MAGSPYDPYSSGGEADAFDVRGAIARVAYAISRHKLLILLCCVLCVGLVWSYMQLFPPIYRAEVLVQAEPEQDKAREQFYAAWNTFRKSELSSEVELMTSGPVVAQVVEQLDLGYEDVYHTHLKHLAYLWSESTIGNWYRAVKEWIFPPKPLPFEPSPEEIEFSKAVNGFKDGAQLEPVPDSHVGYLVVKGPSYRVAEYANSLIDTYDEFRRQTYAKEAETAYQALLEEVERAARELDEVQTRKLRFENENGLAMGFTKDKAVMTNWAELDQRIQEAGFKLRNLRAAREVISTQLTTESPYLLQNDLDSRNPIHDEIRDSILKLQKELTSAKLIFQPDSPEILSMEKQIAALRESLPTEPKLIGSALRRERSSHYEQLRAREQELETDIAATQAALKQMNTTQEAIAARLVEIPKLEKQYLVLQRDQEIALIKQRSLQEKLVQADVSRISARSAPPSLRVVEYASPPDKPVWPKTKLLIIVAVMLGLSGGIALAIVIEMLNNRATHNNLLPRHDLPIYAVVEVTHRSSHLRRMMQSPTSRSTRPTLALERLKNVDDGDS